MSRQLSELRRHRGAVLGVALFAVVALTLTATVAGTLSRAQRGDTLQVHGVFSDATGLRPGDDVRVAGVRIGRVTAATPGTGKQRGLALVTMKVASAQVLHEDVVASVDYLNLMGQRYVALTRPAAREGVGRLRDGATIPLERTRPALDLSALFNAFRPIFDLLQPADLNLLATNIVQVLQGQGGSLQHLLTQTGQLTNGLMEREDVLSKVVDNVNLVLDATEEHREDVVRLLAGLDSLTSGLAKDRDRIATSIDSIVRLTGTTAALVDDTSEDLAAATTMGASFTAFLASREKLLTDVNVAVPQQLETYLRTLNYGSYLNVYVCTNYAQFKGFPARLDLGVLDDRHSPRCR